MPHNQIGDEKKKKEKEADDGEEEAAPSRHSQITGRAAACP